MLRAPWSRVLVATAALSLLPFLLPTTAGAGAAHGTGVGLPDHAAVGETIHATLVITNASTPPESEGPHTISDISLVPSCGSRELNDEADCGSPDPNALVPVGPIRGSAGTACAGTSFAAGGARPSGKRILTPSSPVTLQAPNASDSDRCTIELDLTVDHLPTVDAKPDAGIQTMVLVSSLGTSNVAPPDQPNTTSFSAGAAAITIVPASPGLATQVVDDRVALGEPVRDAVMLSGGADPSGTVAFDLYGPDDADCSEPAVAHVVQPVDGPGTYPSPPATPTAPGTYRFVARYGGDAANAPVAGSCNDPDEAVAVAAAEPPGLRVVKDATPLSRPEPGGTFSFAVTVTNTSAVPLTLTGLHDDLYGDVATQGTCTAAVGTVLQPGDGYACAFPGELRGNAGATQTDTVTATAVDGAGTEVSGDDDAVVSLTDVPPTITVAKTALPEERVAPGGLFTFGLVVTNTGGEPVTITSVRDDLYGDVAALTGSTCGAAVGSVLAPKAQLSCTFPGQLTGAVGAAQTDVVTVTVTDDDGSTGTAKDDATIRLVAPGATTTTSTSTTAPAPPTSTKPPATTVPPPVVAGTPTTAARPPSLARTGRDLRSRALQALLLLGVGLVLTGCSWARDERRRTPRRG